MFTYTPQEESRSVSENCKWRIRKQFQEGIPYTINILGYRLIDGTLEVVPEEAEIVKMVFYDFLSGMGKNAIVKKLIDSGIQTRWGKNWHECTINKMLRNELYVGDLLLQKTFSSNYIEKKKCINKNELPMYYVSDCHEPIIDRNTFECVQEELKRRAEKYKPRKETPQTYPFTGKIVCNSVVETTAERLIIQGINMLNQFGFALHLTT